MWCKFRTQLLNSGIDLNRCRIRLDNNMISISSRLGGLRSLFSLLFGVPFFYLLWSLLTTKSLVLFIVFILFGPVLTFFSVLFGFCAQEIVFNKAVGRVTKKIRLFRYAHEESSPIPSSGRVVLSSKWNSGSSESGSYWTYNVGTGIEGGMFSVSNNYYCAHAFAGKLSGFLGYELDNTVKQVEIR